jgi:hypothetical protein
MADDRRLRGEPGSFERQREDYPLRREFHAFTVGDGVAPEWREVLARLGFSVR